MRSPNTTGTGCSKVQKLLNTNFMSIFKVHNLAEGTRPAPVGYSSWLDYWEKATGMKANWCHRVDWSQRLAKATDGAHVSLNNPNHNLWYIVPLRHKCN